jgi:DNA-binding CsgD family transcriptional regulator
MSQNVFFQWQNKNLRDTIYPFRDEKLRDFLRIYYEIQLMQSMGQKPVDQKIAQEILAERRRLENIIATAKAKKAENDAAIKAAQQQHRTLLSNPDVRRLQFTILTQRNLLSAAENRMISLKRRRDWYEQFAPEHPYFSKWNLEHQASIPPYQEAKDKLETLEKEWNSKLAPYENQVKALEETARQQKALGEEAAAQLAKLPPLDKQGQVTLQATVRWEVLKYAATLEKMNHDQLLVEVIEFLQENRGRFPHWLIYMLIHFSGMRYQSSHGSWADPVDLLESLEVEAVRQQILNTPPPQIEVLCNQAIGELTQQKTGISDARELRKIDLKIQNLKNTFARTKELQNYLGDKKLAEVRQLSPDQVLARLKTKQKELPDWAWKEIVMRTDLRLEVKEPDWETLTPLQHKERWNSQTQHYRTIIDAWKNKDMTAWRKEHERTLNLIVTRAVCNEVSEHIHHLRGLIPAGGLTAKPNWYLRAQAANPGKAFFKRPTSQADFVPGASILWLGWVDREPNAWQIAHPLAGIELVPIPNREKKPKKAHLKENKDSDWKYQLEGNRFVRSTKPLIQKVIERPKESNKPPKVRMVPGPPVKNWLRWTHEAIVVDVKQLADGWYVLTYETGKIGLNLRPLYQLMGQHVWDVFVGYMPPGKPDDSRIKEMLDIRRLLAGMPAPAGLEMLPFEAAITPAVPTVEIADIQERWETLTRRQKQVTAYFCSGLSVREIATLLDTSTNTINGHLRNTLKKLGLKDRETLCPALAKINLAPWRVKSLRDNLLD